MPFDLQVAVEVGGLTLVRDCTCSLHIRHFLTRGEHREHVVMWPHGPNSVSRFMSEHTMHSSSDSWSFRVLILHRMAELLWRRETYCVNTGWPSYCGGERLY